MFSSDSVERVEGVEGVEGGGGRGGSNSFQEAFSKCFKHSFLFIRPFANVDAISAVKSRRSTLRASFVVLQPFVWDIFETGVSWRSPIAPAGDRLRNDQDLTTKFYYQTAN